MLLEGERKLRVRIERAHKFIKAQSLLVTVNNTSLMLRTVT